MKHETLTNNRWRQRNPEKAAAHTLLGSAVRRGLIKPPAHCSDCGREVKVHGHHEDYTKPLEVRWLCAWCHKKAHGPRPFIGPKVKRPYRPRPPQPPAWRKSEPPEVIEEARKLRAEGLTYPAIAKRFGKSKGTIFKWLNKVPYG